jgi:hypothetical protein
MNIDSGDGGKECNAFFAPIRIAFDTVIVEDSVVKRMYINPCKW